MASLQALLDSRTFSRRAAIVAAAGLVSFWLLAIAGHGRSWPPPAPATWSWIPVVVAIAALGGLVWWHRRASAEDPSTSTGWKVAAVLGAVMLLPTLPAAVSSASAATSTVRIDYRATVSPTTSGADYHVKLPTASRLDDVQLVDGTGQVAFVETDHGRAVSIRSDEPVTVAASLERSIRSGEFSDYHPTMTTVADENATWEDDKSFWVFVEASSPVSVDVRIDIGEDCGVYENRIDTDLPPPPGGRGWSTVNGTLDHPHGDFCGIEGLLFPLAVFAFPVSVAAPFYGGAVAVAAAVDPLLR